FLLFLFFFSSRRRHTRSKRDWSSDVCSSDLYTVAGVGTQVADGGLPMRYNSDGTVAQYSEPKETREFNGETFVLETGIRTDFALVHAHKGDRYGNLS